MRKNKSEFGKGFIYSMILFAEHRWYMERERQMLKEHEELNVDNFYSLWFYGAGDHLFEMEIPEKLKETKLGKRIDKWLELGSSYRRALCMPIKEKSFKAYFEELESICIEIDKTIFGVESIKAEWG